MKVAKVLDVSLDFCESGTGGLIFRNPCVEDALELDVGVSQRLPRVALLEGVPHLLSGVLALDELGDVRQDTEAYVAHHALVVLIPILLLLSGLINVRLVVDISITINGDSRNVGARSR
jgi:hypothetical protein